MHRRLRVRLALLAARGDAAADVGELVEHLPGHFRTCGGRVALQRARVDPLHDRGHPEVRERAEEECEEEDEDGEEDELENGHIDEIRGHAERVDDGWIINGEKLWISTGDRAGVVVVWARTGGS